MNFNEYKDKILNEDVFLVWFVNNSNKKTEIIAKDKKEAIEIFADKNLTKPSAYISARKKKFDEIVNN